MKPTIPIVFMFNNNYATPAGVAFYSLLKNASQSYRYSLNVLSSDLSAENRDKLLSIVDTFPNANLEFFDIGDRFSDLWEKTSIKGHFSKEIFCKFSIQSIFPQYDYVVVSDVDVVFTGDVSCFLKYIPEDGQFYIAGIKIVGKISDFMRNYNKNFSDHEISRLAIGAGFMVYNTKAMREHNIENILIDYFVHNNERLIQAEQDVLNLCCFEHIIYIPLKFMTCSYMYDFYKNDDDFDTDKQYSREELTEAMTEPVQLHFATHVKPWLDPLCTKAEIWYKYLAETPFFQDCFIRQGRNKSETKRNKIVFSINLWRYHSKSFVLELRKERKHSA